MSQLSAGARLAPRPQRAAATPQRALRVIRGTVDRPREGVFAAFCLALLVGGFLLVLVLNTSMAKGSFVLDDLQARSGALADEQDGLQATIDAQSAPANLAQRALKLGMVPATTAAFLDLADGRVLGVAKAATGRGGFTVITSPTPVQPKKKPAGQKTTVTKKGTVTTTTVVTPKANGVVQTVATSVDANTKRTVVTTTVVTPQPKDKVKTVVTTVDSQTQKKVVTTTVTKAPPTAAEKKKAAEKAGAAAGTTAAGTTAGTTTPQRSTTPTTTGR